MATTLSENLPDGLSAVLPAYNEAAVIATTLRRTYAALSTLGLRMFEIIVVDDGSTDATQSECEAVARRLSEVRVISHARNLGYGSALRSGFDAARGSAIFLMDSDGQFDPSEVRRLLERWNGDCVVCGYRARRRDALARRAYNKAFFAIVNARVGLLARDVNCAFKLFPRAITAGLTAEGALISTELLVRARDGGCTLIDVPVSHSPRLTGSPTGAKPRVVLRAFAELWDLDRRLRRERRSAERSMTSRPADSRRNPFPCD
jgi:glycosyltransferase involved in cell wall biosynthesis